MNQQTQSDIEQRLLTILQQQKDLYRRALSSAAQLADNYQLDASTQVELDRLNDMIKSTAANDQELLQVKQQLGSQPPSHEVKRSSQELAELIRQMMDAFAVIEGKAVDCRNNLMPQMTQQMQAKRMQSAYSRSESCD